MFLRREMAAFVVVGVFLDGVLLLLVGQVEYDHDDHTGDDRQDNENSQESYDDGF